MAKTSDVALIAGIAVIAYIIYKGGTDLAAWASGFKLPEFPAFPTITLGGQTSTDRASQGVSAAKNIFENFPSALKIDASGTPYAVVNTGNEGLGVANTGYYDLGNNIFAPVSIPAVNPFKEGLKASPIDNLNLKQSLVSPLVPKSVPSAPVTIDRQTSWSGVSPLNSTVQISPIKIPYAAPAVVAAPAPLTVSNPLLNRQTSWSGVSPMSSSVPAPAPAPAPAPKIAIAAPASKSVNSTVKNVAPTYSNKQYGGWG